MGTGLLPRPTESEIEMSKKSRGAILVVWISIGAALGIALHNLPLWLGVCVAVGVASSAIARRRLGRNESK